MNERFAFFSSWSLTGFVFLVGAGEVTGITVRLLLVMPQKLAFVVLIHRSCAWGHLPMGSAHKSAEMSVLHSVSWLEKPGAVFLCSLLLLFRSPSEDVGMDVPFEEGVLSPSTADMRPGERNRRSFPHGSLRADAEGGFPCIQLMMSVTKAKGEKCVRGRGQAQSWPQGPCHSYELQQLSGLPLPASVFGAYNWLLNITNQTLGCFQYLSIAI